MDPATAVGFASSILTFIDFSYKLVNGTLQIIDGGTTTGNDHWAKVADDLQRLTTALETDFLEPSEHEAALRSLAAGCKKLSEKLQAVLQKLTVNSDPRASGVSKWEAFKVSLRSIFKRGEVEALVAQLGEYRSEILARLALILK